SLPAIVRTVRLLDHALELLAGVESDHAPGRNGNGLARFGVAPRPRRLVAHLEIAEARQLHRIAARQGVADFLEKSIDDIFGFALVQPYPFEQQFGEFGFGQGTRLGKHSSPHVQVRWRAPWALASAWLMRARQSATRASSSVTSVSCSQKRNARLFSVTGRPSWGRSRHTSNRRTSCTTASCGSAAMVAATVSSMACALTDRSTHSARSRTTTGWRDSSPTCGRLPCDKAWTSTSNTTGACGRSACCA